MIISNYVNITTHAIEKKYNWINKVFMGKMSLNGFRLFVCFIVPILTALYIFGVTIGLLVTSGLVRFGPSFENIAWASLFFLAPLGCIYYPIEILPNFLQIIAKVLPLVYIFEEMRNILINNIVNYQAIILSIAISIIYFIAGILVFYFAYFGAKKRGTLINMGE